MSKSEEFKEFHEDGGFDDEPIKVETQLDICYVRYIYNEETLFPALRVIFDHPLLDDEVVVLMDELTEKLETTVEPVLKFYAEDEYSKEEIAALDNKRVLDFIKKWNEAGEAELLQNEIKVQNTLDDSYRHLHAVEDEKIKN